MPLMRDRVTGVIREVSEAWHRRWPSDHVPLDAAPVEPLDGESRKQPESSGEADQSAGVDEKDS